MEETQMTAAKGKRTDIRTLWTLFKTCFIISGCTFGGGMVIISMLQKKFVEELKWIGQEEVMDLVVIAQSCPGGMAGYTLIFFRFPVCRGVGAPLSVGGGGGRPPPAACQA